MSCTAVDKRDELDARLKKKVLNHECIHEQELLDRIQDILIEKNILTEDIQSYHDKLDGISKINMSKIKAFGDWIDERKRVHHKVPEFKEGYVVIDTTDNHVLDNRIFDNEDEAKELKMEYYHQMPSLIDNSYTVMKVTSGCIEYGAFPYEEQLYFIYDTDLGIDK